MSLVQEDVLVPLTGNQLMTVSVTAMGKPGPTHAVATGGKKVRQLRKDGQVDGVVSVARHGESDTAKRLELVVVDFHDVGDAVIDGESYSLALALADHRARYPGGIRIAGMPVLDPEKRLMATGCLRISGPDVLVVGVGKFSEKLRCLEEKFEDRRLKEGDVFLFPKENEEALDAADKGRLKRLVDGGLVCFAVEKLGFQAEEPVPPYPIRWRMATGLSALVAVLVIGATVLLFPEDPITVAINRHGDGEADLEIHYRYGGAYGRQQPLVNYSRLPSGEKLTVKLVARRDAYVYIWHFDAHEQVTELVSKAREEEEGTDENLIRAGESIELPGPEEHYRLDQNPGLEQTHIIVSPVPLREIQDKYLSIRNERRTVARSRGLKVSDVRVGTGLLLRGIEVVKNFQDGDETTGGETKTAGRLLRCRASVKACRESFVIQHVDPTAQHTAEGAGQ